MRTKNFYFFIILWCGYFFLYFLLNNLLNLDEKRIINITKDFTEEYLLKHLEYQEKRRGLFYMILPFFILTKIFFVGFLINFINLFGIKITLGKAMNIVLKAESIFLIALLVKFLKFYYFTNDFSIKDFNFYYPLSLINYKEAISTEKWLAYPLQLANVFELMYWGVLAWGIWELADKKISYQRSLGYVALTYGVGLLFWVGVVCFLILSVSY